MKEYQDPAYEDLTIYAEIKPLSGIVPQALPNRLLAEMWLRPALKVR